MVVILIVNPTADSPFPLRGEQLSVNSANSVNSTNTNSTTSISFVSSSSSSQVDPDNTYATTKEEEWVTKKKVELVTKKQIETRVKRQVVLEDGKVVEDSGPIVTTNTTEDTEKQESRQTEHRQLGDDEVDGAVEGVGVGMGEGWVAVPGHEGLVKEVKERTVKTREEKEERLETEDVQHLGDISDQAYLTAIQRQSQEGGDLRVALEKTRGLEVQRTGQEGRIVHQSSKTKRVVDTDDRHHLSAVQADGRVVTETKRTTEHEEVNNTEDPDDGRLSGEEEEEVHKQSSQHYTKTKDQELVEYLADGKKIGEEMRYEAENVEGDRQGDPSLLTMDQQEWDSLSARIRKMRRTKLRETLGGTPLDRKDALTKKPLDFDQEEETRKVETSKWLEHHFGSDSRSSKDSIGDDDDLPATGTSTSFINVTMKSTKNKVNGVSDHSKSYTNGVTEHSKTYTNGVTEHTKNYTNSSSRVFVSSPEAETPPPTTTYFQGISEWKNTSKDYQSERPSRTSFSSPVSSTLYKDRVQVLPTGPNHTFKSSPSPTYNSSNQGSKNFRGSQGSNLNGRSSGPESSSPFQSITEKHSYNRYYRQEQASPSGDRNSSPLYRPERSSPLDRSVSPYHAKIVHEKTSSEEERRSSSPRNHRRFNGHVEKEDERYASDDQRASSRLIHSQREAYQRLEEPAPDYSPPSPRATPSPPQLHSTPPPDAKKKVYQRTRFAADIPPARTKTAQSTQTPVKSSLGQSFRRLVGKLRSASKEKRRGKKGGSRSPSPPTYQQYSIDGGDGPVAPPRSRHRESTGMRRNGDPVVNRYYLGEDPFGGSIYGREKEYDGVTPFRRKTRRGSENLLEEERNARNQQLSANGSSTLGRFSKSTSRLISDRTNGHVTNHTIDYTDRSQTLPRKLHDSNKKKVYMTKSNVERVSSSPQSWESQRFSKLNGHPNSHSMINVSIVNKTTPPSSALGPAKPARTYRSNLLRSKSFNVHAGDMGQDFNSIHKSNPHLHRLDESPPPLKSPGIISSISRSTKDISQAIEEEDYRRPFRFDDHTINKSTGHLNGYTSNRTVHDTKKKIFMKNLQDRAPELFKTLHGSEGDENRKMSPDIDDRPGRLFSSTPLKNGHRVVEYSNSFRSSNTSSPLANGSDRVHSPVSPTYTTSVTHTPSFRNGGEVVNRSVVRRGSKDDYSETIRTTSKSDDPLRPSVTNTVQSFSKKILPVKGGRGKETIESSETKTVTKSSYRGGDRDLKYLDANNYSPRNGGVVIEVRNNRK